MTKKSTRIIREKVLLDLVLENVGNEISCSAFFDMYNDRLPVRNRLYNSKQLGSYLKTIIRSNEDLLLVKTWCFIKPSTTFVKYLFVKITDKEIDLLLAKYEKNKND